MKTADRLESLQLSKIRMLSAKVAEMAGAGQGNAYVYTRTA